MGNQIAPITVVKKCPPLKGNSSFEGKKSPSHV
jgi:hypothetical protein